MHSSSLQVTCTEMTVATASAWRFSPGTQLQPRVAADRLAATRGGFDAAAGDRRAPQTAAGALRTGDPIAVAATRDNKKAAAAATSDNLLVAVVETSSAAAAAGKQQEEKQDSAAANAKEEEEEDTAAAAGTRVAACPLAATAAASSFEVGPNVPAAARSVARGDAVSAAAARVGEAAPALSGWLAVADFREGTLLREGLGESSLVSVAEKTEKDELRKNSEDRQRPRSVGASLYGGGAVLSSSCRQTFVGSYSADAAGDFVEAAAGLIVLGERRASLPCAAAWTSAPAAAPLISTDCRAAAGVSSAAAAAASTNAPAAASAPYDSAEEKRGQPCVRGSAGGDSQKFLAPVHPTAALELLPSSCVGAGEACAVAAAATHLAHVASAPAASIEGAAAAIAATSAAASATNVVSAGAAAASLTKADETSSAKHCACAAGALTEKEAAATGPRAEAPASAATDIGGRLPLVCTVRGLSMRWSLCGSQGKHRRISHSFGSAAAAFVCVALLLLPSALSFFLSPASFSSSVSPPASAPHDHYCSSCQPSSSSPGARFCDSPGPPLVPPPSVEPALDAVGPLASSFSSVLRLSAAWRNIFDTATATNFPAPPLAWPLLLFAAATPEAAARLPRDATTLPTWAPTAAGTSAAGTSAAEIAWDQLQQPVLSQHQQQLEERDSGSVGRQLRADEQQNDVKKADITAQEPSYEITDFEPEDMEEVRQLLLQQPEYPVKYDPYSMRYFYSVQLFPQLSRVARLRVSPPPPSAEEAAGGRPTPFRRRGKIVGVVGVSVDGNSAHVIMVAVATAHRKHGLARTMLRQALYRASMYTPESLLNPSPDVQLWESQLHVWVTQKSPISLYLSLGYLPVEFDANYYVSQSVTGGYRMTLSLPYAPVEDRLRATYLAQRKLLGRREREIRKLGGNPAVALQHAAVPPLVVTNLAAASAEQREQLKLFLDRHVDSSLLQDALAAIADKRLHAFFFILSSATRPAEGAAAAPVDSTIFVPQLPKQGVISNVSVAWLPQSDKRAPLYLYDALLSALTRAAAEKNSPFAGAQRVELSLPVHEFSRLAWCWEAGFRPTKFEMKTMDGGSRSRQQQVLSVALPWEKPEEFALQQQTEKIKPFLLALKKQLRELKKGKGGQEHLTEATEKPPSGVERKEAPAAALESFLEDSSTLLAVPSKSPPQQQQQAWQSADAASDVSTADEDGLDAKETGGRNKKEEEDEEEEEEDDGEGVEEGMALAGRWEHVQKGYAERRAAIIQKQQQRRQQLLQRQRRRYGHVAKPGEIRDAARRAGHPFRGRPREEQQHQEAEKRKPKNVDEVEEEEAEEGEEEEAADLKRDRTGKKGGADGKAGQRKQQYYRLVWYAALAAGLLLLLAMVRLLWKWCRCRWLQCCRYYVVFPRGLRGTADASRRSSANVDIEDGQAAGLPQVAPFKRSTPQGPRSSSSTVANGAGVVAAAAAVAAESYKNPVAGASAQQARRPHVKREGYAKVGAALHSEYVDGDTDDQELPPTAL